MRLGFLTLASLLAFGAFGCDAPVGDTARFEAQVDAGAPPRPEPAQDLAAASIRRDQANRRALEAKSLDELLYEVEPELGDLYVSDRRFAARDMDKPGRRILEDWAAAHLTFDDLGPAEALDVAAASSDADGYRGRKTCISATALFPAKAPGRGRLDQWYRGQTYRHIVRVVGEVPALDEERDVRFCGVVVGRYVALHSSRFRSGLVLVGMVDPNAKLPALDLLWD